MKVCTQCGERYRDRIEFCFRDGEVLLTAPPPQPRKREPVDPNLALIMEVAAAVAASVAAANPGMVTGGTPSAPVRSVRDAAPVR